MNKPPKMYKQPDFSLSLKDRAALLFTPSAGIQRVREKFISSAMTQAKFAASGYVYPGKAGKRTMVSWDVSGGSADSDTLPALSKSRAGSRDLWMNTPIATAAIKRMRTNVVGEGLKLQSRIDRKFLEMSDDEADTWEKNVERHWKLFCKKENCDYTKTNSFEQLTALAYRTKLLSGDGFGLLPYVSVPNVSSRLRINLIEGDQVSNPDFASDSLQMRTNPNIRGGIELDKKGIPVAIHIKDTHPGDNKITFKWKRVPIYGSESNRINVLHIYDKERCGQHRGMPFLAPILEQLKQLTRLADSELMAALVSSFFTVFIKNIPGDGRLDSGFVPLDESDDVDPENAEIVDTSSDVGDTFQELGAGNIISLAQNESIETADPKRPNDSFEPFFNALVKECGAALEIPFEVLIQQFNSNYTASRGAVLAFYKAVLVHRSDLVTDFCQPVYEAFLIDQILLGNISAPGFLTDPLKRMAWCGSRWVGMGPGQIDPFKESKASEIRLSNFQSTHEDEALLNGIDDWDRLVERRAREERILKTNDLQKQPVDPNSVHDGNDVEDLDDEEKDDK